MSALVAAVACGAAVALLVPRSGVSAVGMRRLEAVTRPVGTSGASGGRLGDVLTALCLAGVGLVLWSASGRSLPTPSASTWAAGLLVVLVLAAVSGLRRRAGGRRALVVRSTAVLELCEELAGDLAAGAAPAVALERSARRWPEVAAAATAQRLGGSVPAAWRTIAAEPGASDLHVVAAAWQVAEQTGAGLADALTTVAAGIRDQQRTRRLVASELASARATARLMACLPMLTLAVGSGAGDPVGFLVGTPFGLACAAAGLGLALAGVAWIEAIGGALEREAAWQPEVVR